MEKEEQKKRRGGKMSEEDREYLMAIAKKIRGRDLFYEWNMESKKMLENLVFPPEIIALIKQRGAETDTSCL